MYVPVSVSLFNTSSPPPGDREKLLRSKLNHLCCGMTDDFYNNLHKLHIHFCGRLYRLPSAPNITDIC